MRDARAAGSRARCDALAAAEGVQRSYTDTTGRGRRASPAALAAVLRALGHDVDESGRGAAEALRAAEAARAGQLAEPVAVAWGRAHARIRADGAASGRRWTLALEDGGELHGARATTGRWSCRGSPYGCHRLHARGRRPDADGRRAAGAAARARRPAARRGACSCRCTRCPGPFGPGDLSRMRELAEWTAGLGGDLVGSTPLNAAFLDEPFEPSPYLPGQPPVLERALRRPGRRTRVGRARRAPASWPRRCHPPEGRLIDYRGRDGRQAARARGAAGRTSRGPRLDAFERAPARDPELAAYAGFRARCERERAGWRDWREPADAPGDEAAARYHAYAQWLCEEQLARRRRRRRGPLPRPAARRAPRRLRHVARSASSSPRASRSARRRTTSSAAARTGASRRCTPAGMRETRPRLPDRLRSGALCRHAAAAADRPRHGPAPHCSGSRTACRATEGVYVRYPSEELYAVLCIESHRRRTASSARTWAPCPAACARTMAAHGLLRTYAVQAELGHAADPLDRVPSAAMVGMNTHDMPTFAGFWDEDGAADGRRDALRAALRRRGHAVADGPGALDACLVELAGSDARALLVSLEDLWGEREPQNVPGTTTEHPNWRRLPATAWTSSTPFPTWRPAAPDRRREEVSPMTEPRTRKPPAPRRRRAAWATTTCTSSTRARTPALREARARTRRRDGAAGTHVRRLGARTPSAVSVIGDFNGWDARRAPAGAARRLRHLGGLRPGRRPRARSTSTAIVSRDDGYRVDKADPFALRRRGAAAHRRRSSGTSTTTGATRDWMAGARRSATRSTRRSRSTRSTSARGGACPRTATAR